MASIKKPIYLLSIIGIFSLIFFVVPAQSEQKPIDCLICYNAKLTTIIGTADLTIMGLESKQIVIDNTQSKFFDNMTGQGVGIMKIEKGKMTGNFLTRYQDPDGDLYITEATEVDWKCIYGTGKYKGISAGGKYFPITKGKPISPGTDQTCIKVTGTYEFK